MSTGCASVSPAAMSTPSWFDERMAFAMLLTMRAEGLSCGMARLFS